MPAKRALRLDVAAKSVHEQTPKKNRQGLSQIFSPTTGTCQLSPMLSPNVDKGADVDPAETELSNKEQTPTVKMGNFMALHSRAENSLAMFLKMRKGLRSLQAAEGSRELENIFGVSGRSQDLKAELKRTKALMLEVKKRKLMHAGNANHP